VGNIECNGLAQVFGRIEGQLSASDLLISDGAQVEGSIIAQDVTVCGRVKGTIRAVRCRTVVWSRVIFFTNRCRSTRTLSLKDRRGGLRNQRSHCRASPPMTPRKKTCRNQPPPPHQLFTPIFSALKNGFRTAPLKKPAHPK